MGMESHTIGEEGVMKSQANTVFVAEKFSRDLKFIYLHEQVVVKFNKRELRGAWRGVYMIPKPYWLRKYVIKNMVFPEKLVQRFNTRVSDNQGRIYNVYRAEWRFLMAQPFMTLLADGLDSLATTLATPGYPMQRLTSDAQRLRTAFSSPSFSESLESVATGLVELYELFDNLVIRLEEADNSGEGFSTETSSDFITHFLYAQEIIQYSTEGLHDLIRLNENLPQNLLSVFKMIIESPKFKQEAIETGIIVDDTAFNQESTQDKVQKAIDSTSIIKGFKEPNISKKSNTKASTTTKLDLESSFRLEDFTDEEYSLLSQWLTDDLIRTTYEDLIDVKSTIDPTFSLNTIKDGRFVIDSMTLDITMKNKNKHPDLLMIKSYIIKKINEGIVDISKDTGVKLYIQEAINLINSRSNLAKQEVAQAFTPPVVNNVETLDSKTFSEISDIVDPKEFDRLYDRIISTMEYVHNVNPTNVIKSIAIGLTNTYSVLNMFGDEAVTNYVISILKNGYDMSQEPWLETYIKNAPATETVTQQATQQEITEGVPLPIDEADSITQSVSPQVPQQKAEVTTIKDSAGEALDKNDKAPGSGAKTVVPKDSDRIDPEDETTDYEIVEEELPIELALEIVAYYNQKVGELSKTIDKPMVVKMKATKSTVETFKNKVPKGVMFDGTTIKQLVGAVKESARESLYQETTPEFSTHEYDEMADIDSSVDVPVDAETWEKGQPIVVKVINWDEFQKTEEVFNNGVGSSPPASDDLIVLSPEVTIDKVLAKRMLEKYERVHKNLLRELDGKFGYVKTAHSKALKLVMDDFKGDKAVSQIAKSAGGFASLVYLIQKYFDKQTDRG